jgi:hypothetical protein
MYIYMASPYTHDDPFTREARYHVAMKATAQLLNSDYQVYSPIVYSHEMGLKHGLPYPFEWWKTFNNAMLEPASELWVLRMDGLSTSKGVHWDIGRAKELNKPIKYLEKKNGRWDFCEAPEGL